MGGCKLGISIMSNCLFNKKTFYLLIVCLMVFPAVCLGGGIETQGERAYKYILGYEVERDIDRALSIATSALDQNDPFAKYCLLFIRSTEDLEDVSAQGDFDTLTKDLLELAAKGNLTALDMLGSMYYFGLGVQQDREKAKEFWLSAASKNYPPSQNHMGVLLRFHGEMAAQQDAIYWYSLAANAGYAPAQDDLGYLYYTGTGVAKDVKLAYKWFKLASDQNFPEAQYNLGLLIKDGKGEYGEPQDALLLFEKSSSGGFLPATHSLAEMYFTGFGVTQNVTKATELILFAAERGYHQSQNTLGLMYINGLGVDRDYQLAYSWFLKSAKQGNREAINNIEQMLAEDLVKEGP